MNSVENPIHRKSVESLPRAGDAVVSDYTIQLTMGNMDTSGAGTKRKPEECLRDGQPSPSQRQPSSGLTLEAFSALLAAQTKEQTKELQESTSKQLAQAIEKLEHKTNARIDKVEEVLKGGIRKANEGVDSVKEGLEHLAKRVSALESGSVSADGSTTSGEARLAIIFGGWRRDTQKQHIEGDFKALLSDLEVEKDLDRDWFVPGRRSSVVIAPIVVRRDETPGGARDRVLKVVEAVRSARMQTEHLQGEATIWATISKPRAQRLIASHAGKVRRLLWSLGIDARRADCEYSSGTVWMGEPRCGVSGHKTCTPLSDWDDLGQTAEEREPAAGHDRSHGGQGGELGEGARGRTEPQQAALVVLVKYMLTLKSMAAVLALRLKWQPLRPVLTCSSSGVTFMRGFERAVESPWMDV